MKNNFTCIEMLNSGMLDYYIAIIIAVILICILYFKCR